MKKQWSELNQFVRQTSVTQTIAPSITFAVLAFLAFTLTFGSRFGESPCVAAEAVDSALNASPIVATGVAETAIEDGEFPEAEKRKTGLLIEVELPITNASAQRLTDALTGIAKSATTSKRQTVVMVFRDEKGLASETEFEDALKLARALTSEKLRQVRSVFWIDGKLSGHAVLPVMAADMVLVTAEASIDTPNRSDASSDDAVEAMYQLIAKRRRLFPGGVVAALMDPGLELAKVKTKDGDSFYASGDELTELRSSGAVVADDVVSAAGTQLQLSAQTLRRMRIAAAVVDQEDDVAKFLDLAELRQSSDKRFTGPSVGRRIEITGAIVSSRVRRWRSNLVATTRSDEVNTWLVSLDSNGGSLVDSASLAGILSPPEPPIRQVAGFVSGDARGDAALIALACRPLWMKPGTILGGPGADQMSTRDVEQFRDQIIQIAQQTRRPEALIRGLLDPSLEVYRYTNRKTGRVRYAAIPTDDSPADIDATDLSAAPDWRQGDRIEMGNGLNPSDAIELGLVDGEAESFHSVAMRAGLEELPPPVAQRGFVRFVERIGASRGLGFLLVFIGFSCLSAEFSAPGLGVPGFVSVLCFATYFWINHLAGTAEWLELIALTLGIAFIALEVFVVPGFGIFGVGGLALVVLSVVLMSQTFVVPRNSFQVGEVNKGLYTVLGSFVATAFVIYSLHRIAPRTGPLGALVMDSVDSQAIEESERLTNYDHLREQTGTTTTPLRPSGKARFGNQIVAVVSDGSPIESGDSIRVVQVQGNRIVVEAVAADA